MVCIGRLVLYRNVCESRDPAQELHVHHAVDYSNERAALKMSVFVKPTGSLSALSSSADPAAPVASDVTPGLGGTDRSRSVK